MRNSESWLPAQSALAIWAMVRSIAKLWLWMKCKNCPLGFYGKSQEALSADLPAALDIKTFL